MGFKPAKYRPVFETKEREFKDDKDRIVIIKKRQYIPPKKK